MGKLNPAFTPDRRSFLAGSAIAAAASALPVPALASSGSSDWDLTMASYLAAKHAEEAFSERFYEPHYQRNAANSTYRIPAVIEDRAEAMVDVWYDLHGRLMAMPAPDQAALRWKLEQLLRPGEATPCWSEWFVRQTIADYRRLLGDA